MKTLEIVYLDNGKKIAIDNCNSKAKGLSQKKNSDGQVIEKLHKIVFNKLLSSTHMGMIL